MKRFLVATAVVGWAILIFPGASVPGRAQSVDAQAPPAQKNLEEHPGMQHEQMEGMEAMQAHHPTTMMEKILHHADSGTSVDAVSTPHDMLMTRKRGWMLMLHGVAFLNAIQQSGPRGGDKIFSSNWFMPMAQHELGPGTLTIRTMLSLEPATVTERRYPELFQVGETAFGKPLVDAQHPHDFFMELAALYDVKLGANRLLSFYAAPMGDPAMGPTAFPHRASASEDPLAALGHHLEDSTHVAIDVFTVGVTYKIVRLEASGFHGREPDEQRWNIDSGKVDSWSTRLTVSPARNWTGQYSVTRLHSPEQLNPAEDTLRMTASVSYNRPLAQGNWASMLLWGRNRNLPSDEKFNGYLAESTLHFKKKNSVWGRVENVDRTNELLLGQNPIPPGFQEHFLARIQAYSAGYDRDFYVVPHLATALGAQLTVYSVPASLRSTYGAQPSGVVMFLRVRLYGGQR